VTAYTRLRMQASSDEGTERSGVLAHELRNCLAAATVGFELIKKGTVASGGSVSAVITRNLSRMGSLIHRSLAEVRLDSGMEHRERVPVAELVEEAEVEGALEASRRNQSLTVTTVDRVFEVEVDRQILAGAIANLLQNAFKFTLIGGHVFLRASVTAERVLIEIEDQCGGLPPGKAEELFEAFQQRGEDRTGLGLGLFISRKGIEANDGLIRVRNLPGRGCVFTIDLPRMSAAAIATS
jgi:signal transduction histidine kinase